MKNKKQTVAVPKGFPTLMKDLRNLILSAKERAYTAVNSELVILNWQIGKRLKEEILKNRRAEYGKEIIPEISKQLTQQFGRGFSESSLWNSLYTVETFPDFQILSTLSRELSWSHFKELSYLKDDLSREFYIRMTLIEKWSVRQLRERIDSLLFERTAISKKPEKLIREELGKLKTRNLDNPDLIFRDPYILDFLNLRDTFSEKDLESAILNDLQRFITEFGNDFAFLGRQRRITVDNEDYYMDLLFFHRGLRRLVVIEIKLDRFKSAHKAQMELYLQWLEKYEMKNGEEPPIGLILCAGKSDEHIELLMLDEKRIKVAQYFTQLPPRKVLLKRLHESIKKASEKNKSGKALGEMMTFKSIQAPVPLAKPISQAPKKKATPKNKPGAKKSRK